MSELSNERMRAVTANFFFWQGLRWVPLGLVMIFLVLDPKLPPPWPNPYLGFAYMGLAFILSMAIGRYYGRTFGRVEGLPDLHRRRTIGKWMVVYPAMIFSLIVDGYFAWPIFVSGVVWGVAILAYWATTGKGRHHYPVAAFIVAALSVLPLFGMEPGKAMISVLIGTVGVIYVVGGILDHLELSRFLRVHQEPVDGTV